MASITNAQLADALEEAYHCAHDHIVRSSELPRRTREILEKRKWLQEVVKGYYLLTTPASEKDGSTLWQGLYWNFLAVYLGDRFGKNYVLSPENSLDLHTCNTLLPTQIVLSTTKGGQGFTALPHHYSIFSYRIEKKKFPSMIEEKLGVRVLPLELALSKAGPSFFEKNQVNALIALRLADPHSLARYLLDENSSLAAAERLHQKFITTDQIKKADQLKNLLHLGGIFLHEPKRLSSIKKRKPETLSTSSPYAERIQLLWETMREPIIKNFPTEPGLRKKEKAKVLRSIEETYANDAYHSLSIEGYQVSKEMLEKVRSDKWNPDHPNDRDQLNAMAAKGYLETFRTVKKGIIKIFEGKKAATLVEHDLQTWFTALFSPSLQLGIVKASDLIGYRNKPVYIRNSQHVPPAHHGLMDCMEAFFRCLKKEPNTAVQAILGHFMFTFIHPFHDGNGRLGRFLMNFFFIAGGYPWTIIRSEPKYRTAYLEALEEASVKRNIVPFTKLVARSMKVDWSKVKS